MKRILPIILALILALIPTMALAETAGEQTLSLTTGLPTDHEYKAIAVNIDNSPGARPHMNMTYADVVYEIEIYNGGSTRYTAIFNDEIPELVEAIRSARIVHVDVALDWNAALVHFGGQQMAGSSVYDYFKQFPALKRFDGLSDSRNFYRDQTRPAPYNVIGRLQQMHEATEAPDAQSLHTPLKFSADNPTVKGNNITVFRIPYSANGGYYPSYEYIPAEDLYYRYYNRNDMIDVNGGLYTASNVIVMYADYSWYDGASERPIVALTGSNKCEYFIGGKHFSGTWTRSSVNESTVYLDDEGNEVLLKPGKTFIQIVKPKVELELVR